VIPNHACASLSELDLRIARAVPPGGNWRDIPSDIPSARLAQIRVSAAAGEGSRSTYYGRLHPDRPAYTVNTYYNRPGNGCFLHHDSASGQHRTLSHREAARLQSFPDAFIFGGPQRAICQQIGNAVPPLLAYQVARSLGPPGVMIDVFAGAGGLSLGFEWAGWESLAAVDLDRHAVTTFNANVAPVAFVGDMENSATRDSLLKTARKADGRRVALVGGPPCQGFSTGGKRRSSDDARNGLHASYALLLDHLRPDVFIFENVIGLLNMGKGQFLTDILRGLRSVGYEVAVWRLSAARFGIPQRRDRVMLVGVPNGTATPHEPTPWTVSLPSGPFAPPPVCGVAESLDDLPALAPGEDGSGLPYRCGPVSNYQRLVRGLISPAEYIAGGQVTNDTSGQRVNLCRISGYPETVHAR
jgi:DNA (cytosine-5)-methyltransferase 1